MFAAVADIGRALLAARILTGLAHAKAVGKALGRSSKTPLEQREEMNEKSCDDGEIISRQVRDYGQPYLLYTGMFYLQQGVT